MDVASLQVLVVDDSGAMRRILCELLEKLGIGEIDEAEDGTRALHQLRLKDYDLVLMDWNMPQLNGLETVKTLRAQGSTVPVIMVTTEGDKSKVVQALSAGANNYVTKPFSEDILAAKLWITLGQKKKANQNGEPGPELGPGPPPPPPPKIANVSASTRSLNPFKTIDLSGETATEDDTKDSLRALVVDDSKAMRHVLRKHLAECGITEVDEAGNGQEAVGLAQRKGYGVVLMDWNMPVMSGVDAVREIRADGATMPIIMITTETGKEKILAAVKAGATNYLGKPFTQDVFAAKLRETLMIDTDPDNPVLAPHNT